MGYFQTGIREAPAKSKESGHWNFHQFEQSVSLKYIHSRYDIRCSAVLRDLQFSSSPFPSSSLEWPV